MTRQNDDDKLRLSDETLADLDSDDEAEGGLRRAAWSMNPPTEPTGCDCYERDC
ncbi:MAG: hypothetical protein L0I76_13065 [Pseudonocardia sp.]|nr:hypothetical protein [Pseudonocardia sp.]